MKMRMWIAAAAAAGMGAAAQAGAPACGPQDARGVRVCKVGLAAAGIARIATAQHRPQWCWAASIAMVLAHHGVAVAQEQLVLRRFGEAVDRPATGEDVTSLLAQPWPGADARGLRLAPLVGDAHARRHGLDNRMLLRELAEGRPLILGVRAHMMVVVQAEYEQFTRQDAVRIRAVQVIDPARGGGLRALTPAEAKPDYVAALRPAADE